MLGYRQRLEDFCKDTISSILNIDKKEFEFIKAYIEFSPLYEELKVIFNHKPKFNFFQNTNSIQMLKYDFSNECGVLLSIKTENDTNPIIIRTIGDESILSEKRWI